jgi:hypothetical protein
MSLGRADFPPLHTFRPPESHRPVSTNAFRALQSQRTSVDTALLLDAKSALFPASAIMMFESACRCSSLIHAFAFSNEDWIQGISRLDNLNSKRRATHSLRDVVHDHSTIGVSVIHWCQRLVPLLAGSIPKVNPGVSPAPAQR